MKTPESLVTAVDCGIIQEVTRPLMSGKEAQIYLVVADGNECVAKVYKEASQRTFKHRAEYTEGRRTRNSRDQRAVSKRTRHGRKQDEAGWRNTEVDMIYRLRDAGVRVPEPINFVDGVLVMELVKDAHGDPAPRLGDLRFAASEALEIYHQLVREVVRMLCAGVIHGDLSDFNVLVGVDGPVLIDFPQSMDAARNQGARKFLLRDVENLHRFVERHCSDRPTRAYGEEMWSLYETNRLEPETELRGDYQAPESKADTGEVLALIEDVDREEQMRRVARGQEPAFEGPRPMRTVVDFTQDTKPRPRGGRRADKGRSPGPEGPRTRTAKKPVTAKASVAEGDAAPKKRRSRRRRKSGTSAASEGGAKPAAAASRRPARPAQKKNAGSNEGNASNDRPRRRRRRRPRTAGSREST